MINKNINISREEHSSLFTSPGQQHMALLFQHCQQDKAKLIMFIQQTRKEKGHITEKILF